MFDSHDRYWLALDVLRGPSDAQHVLADMLDEEGERALAEWARAPKKKANKRLDFVLAILPYKTDLRLACEFLSHALGRSSRELNRGIRRIRAWALSQADAGELTEGCLVLSGLTGAGFRIRDFDRIAQSLHAAAKCAEIADLCAQNGDAGRFRQHAAESRNGVRRVARRSREIARTMALERMWEAGHAGPRPDELAWQVAHVEGVIQEMLEPPRT